MSIDARWIRHRFRLGKVECLFPGPKCCCNVSDACSCACLLTFDGYGQFFRGDFDAVSVCVFRGTSFLSESRSASRLPGGERALSVGAIQSADGLTAMVLPTSILHWYGESVRTLTDGRVPCSSTTSSRARMLGRSTVMNSVFSSVSKTTLRIAISLRSQWEQHTYFGTPPRPGMGTLPCSWHPS